MAGVLNTMPHHVYGQVINCVPTTMPNCVPTTSAVAAPLSTDAFCRGAAPQPLRSSEPPHLLRRDFRGPDKPAEPRDVKMYHTPLTSVTPRWEVSGQPAPSNYEAWKWSREQGDGSVMLDLSTCSDQMSYHDLYIKVNLLENSSQHYAYWARLFQSAAAEKRTQEDQEPARKASSCTSEVDPDTSDHVAETLSPPPTSEEPSTSQDCTNETRSDDVVALKPPRPQPTAPKHPRPQPTAPATSQRNPRREAPASKRYEKKERYEKKGRGGHYKEQLQWRPKSSW